MNIKILVFQCKLIEAAFICCPVHKWNHLPIEVKPSLSVNTFTSSLKTLLTPDLCPYLGLRSSKYRFFSSSYFRNLYFILYF